VVQLWNSRLCYSFVYQIFPTIRWISFSLLPVSSMYISFMTIGAILGYVYELSVSSLSWIHPCYLLLYWQFISLGQVMTGVTIFCCSVISVGILLLSIFEKRAADFRQNKASKKSWSKYQIGALAILLPIYMRLLMVGDTLQMLFILDQSHEWEPANTSYELTFSNLCYSRRLLSTSL